MTEVAPRPSMAEAGWSESRNPVVRAILWVLDPGGNTASVAYGLLTAGAVIAAESAKAIDVAREIEATVVVVLLYWLAHAYAALLGMRVDEGATISIRTAWAAMVKEFAIIRGALLPVAAMLLAWALGLSLVVIEWSGILTAIALLILVEVTAGIRSHLSWPWVLVQGCLGISMGIGIVAVRALLA